MWTVWIFVVHVSNRGIPLGAFVDFKGGAWYTEVENKKVHKKFTLNPDEAL